MYNIKLNHIITIIIAYRFNDKLNTKLLRLNIQSDIVTFLAFIHQSSTKMLASFIMDNNGKMIEVYNFQANF